MRSGSTLKLTLTPDRLQTMEVGYLDRARSFSHSSPRFLRKANAKTALALPLPPQHRRPALFRPRASELSPARAACVK